MMIGRNGEEWMELRYLEEILLERILTNTHLTGLCEV